MMHAYDVGTLPFLSLQLVRYDSWQIEIEQSSLTGTMEG